MSLSVLDMSMSLDGYIADPNDFLGGDDGERLHAWFAPGGEAVPPSGPSRALEDEWNAAGAVLAGRRTAELMDHWGGDHHGLPIFVPSHRPPGPAARWGYPLVTYVSDGIESAMAQAKAAAGDRAVQVRGAITGRCSPGFCGSCGPGRHGVTCRNATGLEDRARAAAAVDRGRHKGEGLGRSRGGLSTTIHLAVDRRGRPLRVLLTPGQAGDNPQVLPLLDGIRVARVGPGRPRSRPEMVIADKASSRPSTRQALRDQDSLRQPGTRRPDRPPRSARQPWRTPAFDAERDTQRNVIERCFNRLKQVRDLATRYANRAASSHAELTIATIIRWLRCMTGHTLAR